MFVAFFKSSKDFILSFIDDDYHDTLQEWLKENVDRNYFITRDNKVFDESEIEKAYNTDYRFLDDQAGFFDIRLFEQIRGFDDIEVESVGYIKVYDTDNIEINGEVIGSL